MFIQWEEKTKGCLLDDLATSQHTGKDNSNQPCLSSVLINWMFETHELFVTSFPWSHTTASSQSKRQRTRNTPLSAFYCYSFTSQQACHCLLISRIMVGVLIPKQWDKLRKGLWSMGRGARDMMIYYTKAYSVVERNAKYSTLVNSSRVG